MGMFDEYEPDPRLACPACGAVLEGWQGKDGPCALLLWRQGVARPVDQAVPDAVKGYPAVIDALRLPDAFEIYTMCCGGSFFVTAWCTAPGGVWMHTELETAENARQRPWERSGDFKLRLRWLRGQSA